MASTDYEFKGWLGYDKDAVGNMKYAAFQPKPFEEQDVDIKIHACGICGSDIHKLRSGWGATKYPCCVGHEITGEVVRVGSAVKGLKIGDRVGVGAQSSSCHECEKCLSGRETMCPKFVSTYDSLYPDGSKSYGGYANYSRVPYQFVFKLPDNLSYEVASTMFCAGVTSFRPLYHANIKEGSRVAIIGLGGLGHYGVLFAKAMGAEVTVISRSRSKEEDSRKMGATGYIATQEEGWVQKYARSFDFILCTANNTDMPLSSYLSLVDVDGTFCFVGLPEGPVQLSVASMMMQNATIKTSLIGTPDDIRAMLNFVAKHEIRPWLQIRPMSEVNTAVVDVENGHPRYRYVLVNE